MGIKKGKTDYLLSLIREGKSMTLGQQLRLTAYLSVPAIMAQVSSIAMQYIDASMVGSLGANAAAWFQPRHGCSGDCVPPLQRDFLSKWHTGLGPEILQERKKYSANRLRLHLFSVLCWRLSAFLSVVCFPAGWVVMK